jgi:hypothetical protein
MLHLNLLPSHELTEWLDNPFRIPAEVPELQLFRLDLPALKRIFI